MNQEDRDKLNQIEADAHHGVFSERDVCALIQCYREKCAEVEGLQQQLADASVFYMYMYDDDSPALSYDEWITVGKPSTYWAMSAENRAIVDEIEQRYFESLRRRP